MLPKEVLPNQIKETNMKLRCTMESLFYAFPSHVSFMPISNQFGPD